MSYNYIEFHTSQYQIHVNFICASFLDVYVATFERPVARHCCQPELDCSTRYRSLRNPGWPEKLNYFQVFLLSYLNHLESYKKICSIY